MAGVAVVFLGVMAVLFGTATAVIASATGLWGGAGFVVLGLGGVMLAARCTLHRDVLHDPCLNAFQQPLSRLPPKAPPANTA